MSQPLNGYVDLQVNGYGGVDFNADDLSAESFHSACERLIADGVAGVLATVITDDLARMTSRLARLAALRSSDQLAQQVIWGLHIEGPFISDQPGYVGAHPARATRPACRDAMQRLLDAGAGLTRIVTLAPERDDQLKVTEWLVERGVRVAAGHCNPSLEQLDAAIDAGLSLFTHLGNGCPLELPRHDNVIQRVLSRSQRLWISFIADGVHVPWHALRNYLNAATSERCLIVSDAISAAGLGPGNYQLGGQQVVVDAQGATWAKDRSHLVGSATTMRRIEHDLRDCLGMSDHEVSQLICDNPRNAINSGR